MWMMMSMMEGRTYYDQNIEHDQNLQWVLEAEKLNYKEREVFQLGGADRVVLAHHLSESGKNPCNDDIDDEDDADDNCEV